MTTSIVRVGIRLVSVATAAIAIWLASVVVLVLPTRDPGHVQVWAGVALGSIVLVGLSFAATRRSDPGRGTSLPLVGLLGLVSIAALAFGLLVVVSFLTAVPSGATEDYLVVVGAILTTHGGLGLAWAVLSLIAARPRSVRTGVAR